MLEYTQCDGLMIGRAAIGDPYIFKRISHYLGTVYLCENTQSDKIYELFYDKSDAPADYFDLDRKTKTYGKSYAQYQINKITSPKLVFQEMIRERFI